MAIVNEAVPERVVMAVAEATKRDALALPPLTESIDPEALDAIVDRNTNGRVTFTYAGHEVTVTHDGTVSVSNVLPIRRSTRPVVTGGIGD